MLKSLKQLPNCAKWEEISIVLIGFYDVLCDVHAYTVAFSYCRFFFLLSLNMNQVPEKPISWSVTVHSKNSSKSKTESVQLQ